MRLFRKKQVIDERERMEMYKIEHYMFWFTFWALFVSIVVQMFFIGRDVKQVAGEWIVFMLMACGTALGDLRGGHYDYLSKPGWKSYLVYSLFGAVMTAVFTLVNGTVRGWYDSVGDMVLAGIIQGVFLFVVLFAALSFVGAWTKKRRKKLEEEFEDE